MLPCNRTLHYLCTHLGLNGGGFTLLSWWVVHMCIWRKRLLVVDLRRWHGRYRTCACRGNIQCPYTCLCIWECVVGLNSHAPSRYCCWSGICYSDRLHFCLFDFFASLHSQWIYTVTKPFQCIWDCWRVRCCSLRCVIYATVCTPYVWYNTWLRDWASRWLCKLWYAAFVPSHCRRFQTGYGSWLRLSYPIATIFKTRYRNWPIHVSCYLTTATPKVSNFSYLHCQRKINQPSVRAYCRPSATNKHEPWIICTKPRNTWQVWLLDCYNFLWKIIADNRVCSTYTSSEFSGVDTQDLFAWTYTAYLQLRISKPVNRSTYTSHGFSEVDT